VVSQDRGRLDRRRDACGALLGARDLVDEELDQRAPELAEDFRM